MAARRDDRGARALPYHVRIRSSNLNVGLRGLALRTGGLRQLRVQRHVDGPQRTGHGALLLRPVGDLGELGLIDAVDRKDRSAIILD
jgi:hypothetical protein